jgi:hypothetical protein
MSRTSNVEIQILDPDNAEILQSAEIVSRELRARGMKVLVESRSSKVQNDRNGFGLSSESPKSALFAAVVKIAIGGERLASGMVELKSDFISEPRLVPLEDAVDKAVEIIKEAGL